MTTSALVPAEAEIEQAHDEEARRAAASPGLNQFRRNPFRVLRLPAAATSKQAVWKAEKALSLTRAGMPLPGADAIPWLPAADELEIQQAAQAMEEPLSRLCEQLLWFDIEADPMGEELRRALQGDDAEAILRVIGAREPAPPADPGAPAWTGDLAAMVRRIHDANFRLLLAFSMLHEVGPGASTGLEGEEAGSREARAAWGKRGGLECIEDAHALFAPDQDGSASACVRLLREALACWGGIFGDPRWGGYLRAQIARLDDELVSGDDAEALTNAVAARIVDLVAGEVKLVTISGRLDRTVELVRAAAQSGVAPDIWRKAFRGLRYVFRAELDEIGAMSPGGAPESLEDVQVRVARLAALDARWRELDEAGLLGLAPLVDECAMQAFERLRSIHGAAPPAERVAQQERVLEALEKVRAASRSPSLRERIAAFSEQVRRVKDTVCHFCRKREPSCFPTVLEATSEVSRQDFGSSITINYCVERAIVQRCERCADLHQHIRACRTGLIVGLLISMLLASLLLLPGMAAVGGSGARLLEVAGSAALVAAFMLLAVYGKFTRTFNPVRTLYRGFVRLVEDIAAYFITPRGERTINDVKGSAGFKLVGLAHSIRILSSKDAALR